MFFVGLLGDYWPSFLLMLILCLAIYCLCAALLKWRYSFSTNFIPMCAIVLHILLVLRAVACVWDLTIIFLMLVCVTIFVWVDVILTLVPLWQFSVLFLMVFWTGFGALLGKLGCGFWCQVLVSSLYVKKFLAGPNNICYDTLSCCCRFIFKIIFQISMLASTS